MATGSKRDEDKKRGKAPGQTQGKTKPAPQAEGPGHTENPNMPTRPGEPEDPRRPGNPDYPDQPREGPDYRKNDRNPYQT